MQDTAYRAIAIVGAGAILPDAPNVPAFWKNITAGRYSISEVTPDRWDPALYYDSDHNAPDKTYSKIGGWVREYRVGSPEVAHGDSAARRRCHGRGATLGDRVHPRSAGRLRLPGAAAEHRAHGRHSRQRDGRGEALSDGDARPLPGIRPRTGGERHLRRAARRGAARHHAGVARAYRQPASAHHGRQHARRTGQLPRRPDRQRLQLPRPELRLRRGLRLGHGGDPRRGGRA